MEDAPRPIFSTNRSLYRADNAPRGRNQLVTRRRSVSDRMASVFLPAWGTSREQNMRTGA